MLDRIACITSTSTLLTLMNLGSTWKQVWSGRRYRKGFWLRSTYILKCLKIFPCDHKFSNSESLLRSWKGENRTFRVFPSWWYNCKVTIDLTGLLHNFGDFSLKLIKKNIFVLRNNQEQELRMKVLIMTLQKLMSWTTSSNQMKAKKVKVSRS